VPLLELVRSGRFNANNRKHRLKLLRGDSLLEFLAGTEDAPATLIELGEIQMRYRAERSAWAARPFERLSRSGNEDGEPLTLVVL
jgi:hypothetical protein